MPSVNDLLNKIDELERTIEDRNNNLSKHRAENEAKIRRLQEQKQKLGLHSDRSAVYDISSKIERLKSETDVNYEDEFDFALKKYKKLLNGIIFDYYRRNVTIEEIFKKENVSVENQNRLLKKSNFGRDTGYLYVEEIFEGENIWRYYNPITGLEVKGENLKVLKNNINSREEELIEFDGELANRTRATDSVRYEKNHVQRYIYRPYLYENRPPEPIDDEDLIDEKLDELEALTFNYQTARHILEFFAYRNLKVSNEQIQRLCEISITNSQVYNCNTCKTSLKRILGKYKDIIDDGLYNKVIQKNGLYGF